MPAVGSGRSAQSARSSSLPGGPADPEHLLLDRVGRLAQAAGEQLDALEQRNVDPIEGVPALRSRATPSIRLQAAPSSGSRSRVPRAR